MLARMLESPPGVDDDTLVEELTDMLLRYLVRDSTEGEQTAREPASRLQAGRGRG